jgi:hypothetical protein
MGVEIGTEYTSDTGQCDSMKISVHITTNILKQHFVLILIILYEVAPECIYIKFVAELCIDEAMTSATCWVTGVMRLSTGWHIFTTQCHTNFTR